ncbi:Kelch-like protein 28 [Nymphon striatum]|nr:Kelch-like protein 28 [Nymphon striatum]
MLCTYYLRSSFFFFREKFRENPGLNKMEINEIRFETVNKIFDYFYSDSVIVNKDELNEKRIFEIVVEWTNVDIRKRQPYGQQLLEDVRFPLMPLEYLHQIKDHEIIQTITKKLNEHLICIGGFNEVTNDTSKSIEICYNLGSSWSGYDETDTRRVEFAVCTYEKRLCTKYNPQCKSFTELEPLPDPRYRHVATIINSELFVLGGGLNGTEKSLISLNLNEEKGKWRNRESSLQPRCGSTGCSANGKFYVFGGYMSNSCEYYCPQQYSWKSLPKMKEERWFAGSCYDNKKFIYVVAGMDLNNKRCLTSMERFNVDIGQWLTLKSSIGVGLCGLTLTVFENHIILIGGCDQKNKTYKAIQKYDWISDSWIKIGNLKETRAFHCTGNWIF